ncbi:MAG: N-acetylglucosamine-6-phosphate deacetylase [Dehalococcoidia bacterium]
MLTALTNARILTPDQDIGRGVVVVEDGRIREVGAQVRPPPDADIIDLEGATLVPGFIDLHVHGGGGFSLSTADPEQIRAYARWVVAHGVTSFLCSIVAATPEGGLDALRAVAGAAGPVPGGAHVLGAHLEGPFVSPQRRGALPESWIRRPDVALFDRLLDAASGHLRVITIAPELPDAGEVARAAIDAGCVVAVGHSDATYEQAREAFDAGAGLLTHAFNAMRPFHHREPGPLGAAFDSPDATIELIADGVHVHPAAARLAIAAKGSDRVALVTDGTPPAGGEEGAHRLGGVEARLSGGRITLPDGTIAGGAMTMEGIVRNTVDSGLATLLDAVRMASTVPAAVLGLGERKGRLAAGYDADLVALNENGVVLRAWAAGDPAYVFSPI